MLISSDDEKTGRNVIPRLRDFATTLALGELRSVATWNEEVNDANPHVLDDLFEDWSVNRTLSFAADLVSSGFALGLGQKTRDAADFIVRAPTATDLQLRIAQQAINPEFGVSLATPPGSVSSDDLITASKEQVRIHRKNLRASYRNPVRLVELAREYATLGNIEKAVRTMNVAVALAPANRFVLRSASRLYVHAGDLDRAHYALKSAPSLRSDPWLLAAEIAVSAKRGRTSHHVREGLLKVENTKFDPFDLSELMSAIATIEIENANSKAGKKLFRQAMKRPTENSIAQMEWVSRNLDKLAIEVQQVTAPRNYEALAWDNYGKSDLSAAIEHGKNWIIDQPFAVAPVLFTGVAAAQAKDSGLSASIYKFGLSANPESHLLRNNYAFILASTAMPKQASKELERIDKSKLRPEIKVTITATEGLIAFRQGDIEGGRELYGTAISIAEELRDRISSLRARMFLAREEIVARTDAAVTALEDAENRAKGLTLGRETARMLQELRRALTSQNTDEIVTLSD